MLTAVVATLAVAVGGAAAARVSSSGYVVQPGDSLWLIATRSGTNVAALAATNHMGAGDVLAVGRHLRIPGATAAGPVTPAAGAATARPVARATTTARGVVRSAYCASSVPVAGPAHLPQGLATRPQRLALRPLFARWASYYGVRASLIEAIAWQESGWQEGVVSPAGAIGIGQVTPAAADFVSRLDPGAGALGTDSANIRVEAAYVAYLVSHTASTCDAIAAYYEGLANLAASGVFSVSKPYVANVEYLIPGFS